MRTIFKIIDGIALEDTVNSVANSIAKAMGFNIEAIDDDSFLSINEIIESKDGALIIVGISNNRSIQKYLNNFREIRIPYLFIKNGQNFDLNEIVLPITNLMEEKEKGPFASSFARFFNAKIKIYQPNDYGTRAKNNIDSICNLFDSFSLTYSIYKGLKDSNGIELEAALNEKGNNKLLIITASREYGLDDIIFGPKERKIIKKSDIPVMLINPRGDLYALCE